MSQFSTTDEYRLAEESRPAKQVGEHLSLPLECPKCGKLREVLFSDLSRAIDCYHCGETFALGSGGRVCVCNKLVIRCPRCLEATVLPERTVLREFTCEACHLNIALPRSHGKTLASDQDELRRRTGTASPANLARRAKSGDDYLPRIPWYAYASAAALVLLLAMLPLWRSVSRRLPEELAAASKDLMLATVSGDRETIDKLIDSRHGASYRMWVRETVRPALGETSLGRGSTMRLQLARREGDRTWIKVIVIGPQNESEFHLAWKMVSEGQWQLDALDTAGYAQKHSSQNKSGGRSLDVSF